MRFARCTLDLEARRLFRGAREVHLSPKAFELLKVLVESRPRAVSKTELLDRVWPGIFVSEASLARVVNEIRDGLGDRARRIVRTVHGHGYAFAADIEDESQRQIAAAPTRAVIGWLTSADREFPLHPGDQLAGRGPAAEICLDSPKVSRRHARFVVEGATVIVEDLGSKNGTFVSGSRISEPLPLKSGDEVRIGPFTFVFHPEPASGSTQTEIAPQPVGGLPS